MSTFLPMHDGRQTKTICNFCGALSRSPVGLQTNLWSCLRPCISADVQMRGHLQQNARRQIRPSRQPSPLALRLSSAAPWCPACAAPCLGSLKTLPHTRYHLFDENTRSCCFCSLLYRRISTIAIDHIIPSMATNNLQPIPVHLGKEIGIPTNLGILALGIPRFLNIELV